MAKATGRKYREKPEMRKRIWRGGEIDADPFALPQIIAVKASGLMDRVLGFIRYATINQSFVEVVDSSPIFGRFNWQEGVASYEGIALRVLACPHVSNDLVAVVEMSHRGNPERNIILYAGEDGVDAGSRWRAWGRMLRLPLLIEDRDGMLHPAENRLGALNIGRTQPHSGANPLSIRRPLSFGQSGQPRLWGERVMAGNRPQAYHR